MKIRYFEKRGEIWLDFRDQNGKRHRPPTGCKTQAQAELLAPGIVASYLSGSPTLSTVRNTVQSEKRNDAAMTLRQAFDKGMMERESWVDSKSKESLRGNFKALTTTSKLLTEGMQCSVMTRELMMALRAAWQGQDGIRKGTKTSASTINHRLVMASTLLDIAQLPPHNVKGLTVKNNRRMRRTSDLEIQAVVSWLHANHKRKGALLLADLITLGLNTTARKSELLGLAASDLFLDGPEPYVVYRDTKNGDTRFGAVTDTAKRILERRLAEGGQSLFGGLGSSQAAQLWADAREALGLAEDKEFVFHVATRHEGLSRLGDDNASAYIVQAYGGHKSIASSSRYVKPGVASLNAAGKVIQQSTVINNPTSRTDAING